MKKSLHHNIIGNHKAVEFIEKIALAGRNEYLSGSYILTGYDETVSFEMAQWLFSSLACIDKSNWPCGDCLNCHQLVSGVFPDYYQIELGDEKQNISIEQIKDMISRLSLSSFSNNYRFVLIKNAETLSLSAANSLLKTLEEPGARIIIVLLATDLGTLPSTIASRSQIINFRQVPSNILFDHLIKNGGLKRSLAKSIARLSLGKFGLAQRYLNDNQEYERRLEMAQNFIAVLGADVSQRLKLTQNIFSKKDAKTDVKLCQEIVLIWQTVIRDIMLLNLNQPELIQNDCLRSALEEQRYKFDLKRLISATKLLNQAKLYLSSNVNAQMALENALLNI